MRFPVLFTWGLVSNKEGFIDYKGNRKTKDP